MSTENLNALYFKCERIIDTVINEQQLEISRNCINSYLELTKDGSGHEVLMRKFAKKLNELNNGHVYNQ